MKYLFALLVGFCAGVVAFAIVLFYNPFTTHSDLSPLSVSNHEIKVVTFNAVAQDAIAFTNDGDSAIAPYPDKIQQLWEPTIKASSAFVAELRDSRGTPVGLGIKLASRSKRSNILRGQLLVDSTWQVIIPGHGSLLIGETENYWDFVREVVASAELSSSKSWRGTWRGTVTSGPLALGTARVLGGSGEFANLDSEATETLSATAYALNKGPVAMEGELAIDIDNVGQPAPADTDSSEQAQ